LEGSRKVNRRRESRVGWTVAPEMRHRGIGGWVRQAGPDGVSAAQAEGKSESSAEGMQQPRNRRLSSKVRLTGKSKTQVGDGQESRAGDATAGVGRMGRSGRAGRGIGGASRR